MRAKPGPIITVEQWEALPETEHKAELVEGVVVMEPPATFGHNNGQNQLQWVLRGFLPRERWAVTRDNGVYLQREFPPADRVPDLMVIRREAFDRTKHSFEKSDVVLVVEFVSQGSRGRDVVKKRHEYAKAGIPHYWILDLDAADPPARFLALELGADGQCHEQEGVSDGERIAVTDPFEVSFAIADVMED
ncbi:MAG: Uma2 family endonuclease [Segniliparus sp.]|uniref:Uma2 family endonuclease n=1 Tax=Segniliparus sp. TaxID=2804064 RepID=UPI003F31107B